MAILLHALALACLVHTAFLAAGAGLTCDCSDTRLGTPQEDCPNGLITYVCNDNRLGPIHLPEVFPLVSVVNDYDRFGHLTPGQFLAKYWNSSARNGTGDWKWPDKNGFLLDVHGNEIMGQSLLTKGTRLDRFGKEDGKFVAAAEGPFSQRALPPSSLNTDLAANESAHFPAKYHVYELLQDLNVTAGLVSPWFGQPGLGSQYWLPEPITTLVENGVFKRLNLEDLNPPNTTAGCGKIRHPRAKVIEDL